MDNELHCLTACVVGQNYRPDLFSSIVSTNSNFSNMCNLDKFKTLVCPTSAANCKLVSRFLDKQFSDKEKIDLGVTSFNREK